MQLVRCEDIVIGLGGRVQLLVWGERLVVFPGERI